MLPRQWVSNGLAGTTTNLHAVHVLVQSLQLYCGRQWTNLQIQQSVLEKCKTESRLGHVQHATLCGLARQFKPGWVLSGLAGVFWEVILASCMLGWTACICAARWSKFVNQKFLEACTLLRDCGLVLKRPAHDFLMLKLGAAFRD